ncbi:hypothetical protein [Bacillus phage BM-P1]|uniref:Uncharacterized protein n=1 Tax=Bacillus phage vB_BsuM-Goe3 TaxID=1933063 RepID=A0A217ERC5_BPGO3|nr:hypothetical protein HWB07_gp116 [Bacillus phage vB_BsuM-Goe3]APZ82654.1 hypothetical protein Goe3_c19300 [Bacillus phage vB_BsuM-Goe3]UJJ74746.1 hypothetical protein [Bacillus phage BM-P1]
MSNYSSLTDEELLQTVSGLHDVSLNDEWYSRHGINFPYRLDIFGRILNCISYQVMQDSECDKLIVQQANEVRVHRQLTNHKF